MDLLKTSLNLCGETETSYEHIVEEHMKHYKLFSACSLYRHKKIFGVPSVKSSQEQQISFQTDLKAWKYKLHFLAHPTSLQFVFKWFGA